MERIRIRPQARALPKRCGNVSAPTSLSSPEYARSDGVFFVQGGDDDRYARGRCMEGHILDLRVAWQPGSWMPLLRNTVCLP